MNVDWATLAEVFVGLGFAAGLQQIYRRIINRRSIKIDVAAKLQGMSIDFADQMFEREKAALAKADELDKKLASLREGFTEIETFAEELLTWARAAKRELDARGIDIRPIPIRRVR
jgi:hypothetical protein